MKLNYMMGTDIISIILLCYVIILAKINMIFGEKRNKFYIFACLFNILAITFEILSRYLESINVGNSILMHKIICFIHFIIIPAVPFMLIFANYDGSNKLYNRFLCVPLVFNIVICVLNCFNGFIFYINKNNQYVRGNLFIIPVLIGIIYFIVLILFICNFYNVSKKIVVAYGKIEKIFLMSLFFIIVFSCIVQITFHNVYIIWSSVSLSLMLYYIFLREIQINYDCITGIRNRFAYENDLRKIKNCENEAIVMFDLNNLKIINDNNGHCNGDKVINSSAQIIKDSFKKVGVPYRIGGDEFCVICRDVSKKMIDDSLLRLTNGLDEINKTNQIKIGLAFGYSFFKSEFKSIYEVIECADRAMYKHKAEIKSTSND